MITINLFLVVLGLVLLLLDGLKVSHPRVNFGWLVSLAFVNGATLAPMDVQVSLIRLLIGDNSRTAPTYSDATLRQAITFGAVRPANPLPVLLAGTRAAHVYPSDASGGPWTGS